jgi:beta-N-acetylhexosaminidase
MGFDGLKIVQDTRLYRFTSDSVLLSKFARAKTGDTVADFCAGSGIVGFHFYALNKEQKRGLTFTLFEMQTPLYELSKKTAALNGFDNFSFVNCKLQNLEEISQEIADKSIKIVRDYNHIFPVSLPKGGKILMLNILEPHFHKEPTGKEFSAMRKAFEDRGYIVDEINTAKHKKVKEIMDNYDMICLNCKMSSQDYHGATMRIGWNNIMVLWRGYVLQHPKCVFVSYGDPYKLYDMPYLKEYINAFSFVDASQHAVVKTILGEISAIGKNPVSLEGIFEREV